MTRNELVAMTATWDGVSRSTISSAKVRESSRARWAGDENRGGDMAQMLVSITHAKDNRTRRRSASWSPTRRRPRRGDGGFPDIRGVYLSQRGYSDDIHEEGFQPLPALIDSYVANGGQIWVCSPCFARRGLAEDRLVGNALITGAGKAVEFLANGAASLSY
jgi:hypothetical protein